MALARLASADGITSMIATPHVWEGGYDWDSRQAHIAALQRALDIGGININVFPGAEVPMSMCLAGDRERLGRLALAGSRYLLMETAETTFDQLARAVYHVRLCGLSPVLAHPERTGFARREPARLAELMEREEVFCQITAASIEGLFGRELRRTSQSLLKKGLVHLIATDAHSAQNRPPRLSRCFDVVSKIMGEKAARTVMVENPGRVLRDASLERAGRQKTGGRRFFPKLLNR